MEDISDEDYPHHGKRACKDLEIKNPGKNHDMHVQGDTLLLDDVFEDFWDMCLVKYELDSAYFLSVPGLALETASRMTKVKLDLWTDIDLLLMVEEGIRGGICHSIYLNAKSIDTYLKDFDKNKESLYLRHWDLNKWYGWVIWQKIVLFWVNRRGFWFNENFIKDYKEESDEEHFPQIDVQYLKKLHDLHNDLPFLPEGMQTEEVKKLEANLHDKPECVIHPRNLKQPLNQGLVLKKLDRIIKCEQKVWLKSYINLKN